VAMLAFIADHWSSSLRVPETMKFGSEIPYRRAAPDTPG
jgi:hypothetical protein